MAIINAIDCFTTGNTYTINFNGNSVNIGEIWFSQAPPFLLDFTGCIEITSLIDEPKSNSFLQTEYATCYDCYNNNYGVYSFTSCSGKNTIYFDISAFTPTFFSNFVNKGTYFIDSILDGVPIIGCFQGQIGLLPQEEYNRLQTDNLISNTVLGTTAFTSCEDCVSNSPLIYTVERCTGGFFDSVQLPSNLTNQLISYTDGINEFCGTIVGVSSSIIPTHTFVSLFPEKTACDVCLDVKNEKFIIENCVNSNIQEVVWGSQLFQNGSVSNLQLGGGCYEVLSTTTSAITQNLFLDFEPQPDCQACVECHGVFYEYALCSDPLVKVGEILSYEYISGNTAFYHPTYDAFAVTLNTITANTMSYETFYSLLTKTDCLTPDPTYYTVWEASVCGLGTTVYITTTDNTLNIGDTVQTLWGATDFLCVELIEEGVSGAGPYLHSDTKFSTCEECYNNTTIGLRTLDCFTLESEVVDLTYTAWTQTTNYGGFNGSYSDCFLDSNGFCRTIVDVCPLDPIGNTISVTQQYLNCNICTIFHPRPAPPSPFPDPISAGTEYLVCVECSGSTFTITPPHPVWRGAYGNAITLLDAIVLGGPNGLNS